MLSIVLTLSNPSYAEQEAPELTPTPTSYLSRPFLFGVAPQSVISGSAGFRLGVNAVDPFAAGGSAVLVWNGTALSTTRTGPNIYEADVPAELISTTLVASVTLRNPLGSSNSLTVAVLDAAPPVSLPLTVSMSITPGLLSNASLKNSIGVSLADQNGVAISLTAVFLSSSDRPLSLFSGFLNSNGEFTFTHAYSPPPLPIITPTINYTAYVFSPYAYVTSTISVTGEITREMRYFPWINRAPPTPTPPPAPYELSTVYSGTVRITAIKSKGDPTINEADEYVELTNIGTRPVNLTGWRIASVVYDFTGIEELGRFTFPPGAQIESDQSCRIYTNLKDGPQDCGFGNFGSKFGIWPNFGDGNAELRYLNGALMATFFYRRYDPYPTPVAPTPSPTPSAATPVPNGAVIFHGTLQVSNIKAVGDPNLAEADEYVEIKNIGSQPVYVDGWSLKVFVNNQQRDQFIFTNGAVFAAGQLCRIYTNLAAGPDNCGFAFGFASDEPLWPNNGGARASLYNQQNIEVARFTY
jgi:hypothetical protein